MTMIGHQASQAVEGAKPVGEATHADGRDQNLDDAGDDEQERRDGEAARTSLRTEVKYAATM